jgi:photosystem II stability/assembly factor-like uncharacterized protein
MLILVASESSVLVADANRGVVSVGRGLDRPTCLAADPRASGRAWCGTDRDGVFRSDDHGASWYAAGLEGRRVMAITVSPTTDDIVWAGTEPSQVWRSPDGGETWEHMGGLETLPSSSSWSFPPKPHTHHVRWIACHPSEPGRLWVAIEAGALVSTADGGRTWRDRVAGGPYDTHELAIHPAAPTTLRVAAGDGYYESSDAGATWTSPSDGLEVDYLRSVAMVPDRPDVVVVSASSGPYTAYRAGKSDGRLYRRVAAANGRWERVREGWPKQPATIAPLLVADVVDGGLWAADERGLHRSEDGGTSWRKIAGFDPAPAYLRGLAVVV